MRLITNACSFCHKPPSEVRVMIVDIGANICDECVLLCMAFVRERTRRAAMGEREYQSWFASPESV